MSKEPAERTEEEIRAALEFEKKEVAFLEEREKLKKALEGELRKLQSSISQAMENFNERLHKLFELKINTEMVIHQVGTQQMLYIYSCTQFRLTFGPICGRSN